jgi:hypothetical protein
MATLLKINGEKEELFPTDETFQLKEISQIIDGIVEPIFIGEYWLFYCRNGKVLDRPLNNIASDMIGLPVYGNVVIANDSELTKSFFVPPDLIEEIRRMNFQLMQQPLTDNKLGDITDPISEEQLQEQLQEEVKELIQEGYKKLIESGKSFDELMLNFELFNNGIQKIVVPPDKERRLKAVQKMIDYFTEHEEYEKCLKLQSFKQKMINYYDNYFND